MTIIMIIIITITIIIIIIISSLLLLLLLLLILSLLLIELSLLLSLLLLILLLLPLSLSLQFLLLSLFSLLPYSFTIFARHLHRMLWIWKIFLSTIVSLSSSLSWRTVWPIYECYLGSLRSYIFCCSKSVHPISWICEYISIREISRWTFSSYELQGGCFTVLWSQSFKDHHGKWKMKNKK